MIAYNGTEPYVFFSYSHADKEWVEKIIIDLKQKMCHVWYDEGLTIGESFNDEIAEKIINCECFVVVLSEHSILSTYVKAEINYSISKGRRIIAIISDDIKLPSGIEMMVSPYQYINYNSESQYKDITQKLSDALPKNVFQIKKVPFLEHGKYSFFLEKDTIQYDDPLGRDINKNVFEIVCVEKNRKTTIYRFDGNFAYDIEYFITRCESVGDDFFIGRVNGFYIVNIIANCYCCLEICYPNGGSDFNCLLSFSLRVPSHGLPSITMIDYRYIALKNDYKQTTLINDQRLIIRDAREVKRGFGSGLCKQFEELLYRPYKESYNFFGADLVTRELLDLYDDLTHVWNAETCDPEMRDCWSPANPTVGQSAVTAFLVRDIVGGTVFGIPLENGKYHCYNEDMGIKFDFTSEQFGESKLCYENNPKLMKHIHFAEAEQKQRYELLKERLENYIKECMQSDMNQ